MTENQPKGVTQTRKSKSRKERIVARIARLVRQAGLSYDDWRYVSRRVRSRCDLHPAAKPVVDAVVARALGLTPGPARTNPLFR